jgi:hypothetical protein
MNVVEATPELPTPERLSWSEICERYPDEWVVVTNIDRDNDTDLEFRAASVLGHFKRRKEASPRIKGALADHDDVGCYWTGEIRGPIPRFSLP